MNYNSSESIKSCSAEQTLEDAFSEAQELIEKFCEIMLSCPTCKQKLQAGTK